VYLEHAWKKVRSTGKKTRGHIVIDITGVGINTLGYISIIKHLSSTASTRYPEITERVSMVNSSWIVSSLWAAVKPFCPIRTQEKLNILNTAALDGPESVFALTYDDVSVGKANLPDFIGGVLQEGEHAVCPAMSVNDAYSVVLNEILDSKSTHSYPDSFEFLDAALKHAKRVNSGNAERIEVFLSSQGRALF
jgi:hypothetical protein